MDIALRADTAGHLDVALDEEHYGADLASDDSLRTAVILSLLTDRRATPDDQLPHGGTDRRGWWADAFTVPAEDRFGSRLWLLAREKELPAVRAAAEAYAREALQWLLDDGVATSVAVTAQTTRPGWLELDIRIGRGDGSELAERFAYAWEAP